MKILAKPTIITEKIYQEACRTENMDAKFGRMLSKEENNIRSFILNQPPVLGRLPSIEEIKKEFHQIPKEEIQKILTRLDELDVIHLNANRTKIDAAYPFSGSETYHLVKFKKDQYKNTYAMCAIDALGIGFMLDCDIFIHSKCFHCDDKIYIEIVNHEITSVLPKNLVIWGHMDYSCCAATSLCNNINFFSSEQHFEEWEKKVGKKKG